MAKSTSNTTADSNQPLPNTDEIKVEFKILDETISVQATADGKSESANITPEELKTYVAQDSLILRYYKGFADKVRLTLNGKEITPPAEPKISGANGIEFEINKNNINEILQSGKITFENNKNAEADAPVANTTQQ